MNIWKQSRLRFRYFKVKNIDLKDTTVRFLFYWKFYSHLCDNLLSDELDFIFSLGFKAGKIEFNFVFLVKELSLSNLASSFSSSGTIIWLVLSRSDR